MKNGFGILFYCDGSKYSGEWVDDKQHGYGTFEDKDGETTNGQWVEGN